jgi:hypothetical protein
MSSNETHHKKKPVCLQTYTCHYLPLTREEKEELKERILNTLAN